MSGSDRDPVTLTPYCGSTDAVWCPACDADGEREDDPGCDLCAGNGYVPRALVTATACDDARECEVGATDDETARALMAETPW